MDEHEQIDAALQPFAGDQPVGEDLRLDVSPSSIYFRLRDARAEARAEERQADNDPSQGGGVPTQWSLIRKLALEALENRSKDIEVACWLTEALTRHEGLAGLADGVDILVGLIARFWDSGLYPTPEDDAPEDRLIAITGMSGQERDGSLLQPLRKIVLFARPDGTPITLWQFERARDLVGLAAGQSKKKAERSDEPSFLDLEADARGPGQESLRALGREARRAEAAWRALEEVVARAAEGDAVPATHRVRGMIDAMCRLIERYLPDELAAEIEDKAEAPVDAAAGVDTEQATTADAAASLPETREALLDELMRIASLFRQSEPNSPLSFTIEEAVRRARMPWPDLLRELIPDDNSRTTVLSLSGMRSPSE